VVSDVIEDLQWIDSEMDVNIGCSRAYGLFLYLSENINTLLRTLIGQLTYEEDRTLSPSAQKYVMSDHLILRVLLVTLPVLVDVFLLRPLWLLVVLKADVNALRNTSLGVILRTWR
jgi:hypothetical protein